MNALLVAIGVTLVPLSGFWLMHLLAFIAEYTRNPVIELVEEMRKKHHNTNEN